MLQKLLYYSVLRLIIGIILVAFIGCEKENKHSKGVLYGYIYFTGTTIPVLDVLVKLGEEKTTSQEVGYYHFLDIIPGDYSLAAEKEQFNPYKIEIVVSDSSTRHDISMTSETLTGKVAGSVSGMYSGPKTGSELIILNPDNTESDLKSLTDDSGQYEIKNVPKGVRTIIVKSGGEMIYESEIELINTADSVFHHNIIIPEPFEFTDDRDGNIYKGLEIGTQTWMIENLAYLPEVNYSGDKSTRDPRYYVHGYEGTSVSEARAADNYNTYGVLYNWLAAMNGERSSITIPSGVNGICPDGWHLPSNDEWDILIHFVNGLTRGEGTSIAKSLASTSYWDDSSNRGDTGNNKSSNNISGFSALPAGGVAYYEGFFNLGKQAAFWSCSVGGQRGTAKALSIFYHRSQIGRNDPDLWAGCSIRCIKN